MTRNNNKDTKTIEITINCKDDNFIPITHIAAALKIPVDIALKLAFPDEMDKICSGCIHIDDIDRFRDRHHLYLNDGFPIGW